MKTIDSWSFTRVLDFEQCAYKAWLKYAARIPEPERPLPPGKLEHANDRGSRMHDGGEQFVRGNREDLLPELRSFAMEFQHMRAVFKRGGIILEDEWGFDRNWERTDWRTAWHRSKLDAKYNLNKRAAVVIDYKSGRKDGNEAKHGQQLQLYALDAIMLDPQLDEVTAEAWYLDQDQITSQTYPRAVALAFRHAWKKRGLAVTEAVNFPPNPTKFTCKWCPYAPWGTGHCGSGVR